MTEEEKKEAARASSRKHYEANKEAKKAYQKNNKEKIAANKKEYFQENKEEFAERKRKYVNNNKEKIKENQRKNYKKNSTKQNESSKKWRENNKEKIKNKHRLYFKDKIKNDPLFKLKHRIRNRIIHGFNSIGIKKNNKSEIILGCSFSEFKIYIESKWKPWMTWDNYGKYNGTLDYGWDLDHIIPISKGKNEYAIINLSHHTNFQPLCSKINRDIKRNK